MTKIIIFNIGYLDYFQNYIDRKEEKHYNQPVSYTYLDVYKRQGLRITGAKTRWGSCGAKNNLNFPYHLVMAPLACVDSVVVHELCHTVRHDHSPAFWALVRLSLIHISQIRLMKVKDMMLEQAHHYRENA